MTDRRLEFIQTAEKYKPEIRVEKVKPITGVPTNVLKDGDSVVFDFGNHYVGRVKLGLSSVGSHQDAPAFIKVKFCEAERELHEDSADYHGWISKGWIQEEWMHVDVLPAHLELPRRYAFRYVKVEVLAVSGKYSLVIDSVEADTITSAKDGSLKSCECLTETEKRIDEVATRTLRNCMQDVFEDGPKRDRRLWIGDLRLQALANYATYGQNDLVKRCLYLFAGTADDNGRVRSCLFTEPEIEGDDTYMFDYSLFFIDTLLSYYKETKDIDTVLDLYDTAVRQLIIAKESFDENHVMKDSDVLGWCFLDWNLALNKQTGAQAVYIYSERAMIELANIVLEHGSKNVTAQDIEMMKEDVAKKVLAAREVLFDKDKNLFVSGEGKQISYAANVWAILAHIWDEDKNREILNALAKESDAEMMVTPYMHHHYVAALLSCGEKEKAYNHMISYWGDMVEKGADTFYELYNPENPFESPYGSSIVNSYCHAWSCTPTYLMRMCGLTKENI